MEMIARHQPTAPWESLEQRAQVTTVLRSGFVKSNYRTLAFKAGGRTCLIQDMTVRIEQYKRAQPQPFPWGTKQMHVVCLNPLVVAIDTAGGPVASWGRPRVSTNGFATTKPLWFIPTSEAPPVAGKRNEAGRQYFELNWGRLVFDETAGEVRTEPNPGS